MATNFQLTASIKSVTFLPRDFVRIDGGVWSNHRGGLVVGDDVNIYNKKWFWNSDLPEPVADVLRKVADAATENLVERKALPTFWPKGLMEEEQLYPFNMHFESLKCYNSDWDKDKLSEAKIRITSEHHLANPDSDAPRIIFSTVKFDEGWELNKQIFQILEEHM